MKNIKIPGVGKPDATVSEIASGIIAGATGKTELANSPVTLVQLGTERDDVDTAFADESQAKAVYLTAREARKNATKVLRTAIKRFAQYANIVYVADKMKLAALGLDVIDAAPPVGVLPAPLNLRSRLGKLNQSINLLWNAVRGRESHELQCAESASGPWTEVYRGKKSRASCPNLVSGKEYFFRVRAYGAGGFPGAWSDITSCRAS